MPTAIAEPTLEELLQAFRDGARSADRYIDAREGAVYDHFGGVAAIHWTRQARRDTDLFRAIYFGLAEGKDLTRLLDKRYSFERIEDSYGTGTARLSRPTTVAADGTIWEGTRIVVGGPLVEPRRYVVDADTPVGATDKQVTVDVRGESAGPGSAIAVANGDDGLDLRIEDPLWDSTWNVDALECTDGTALESAPEARARFRQQRLDQRVGFATAIIQACIDAGAVHAVIFPSDYGGDEVDFGLNMAYVGDASYAGTDELVRKVQIALEAFRVLGDQLQVRPLSQSDLVVAANVQLWESPARVNLTTLRALLTGATLAYFDGRTSGFSYDRDALSGAMMKAAEVVQFVTFDSPTSDVEVLATVNGLPNFPATLSRYRLLPENISFNFLPPS